MKYIVKDLGDDYYPYLCVYYLSTKDNIDNVIWDSNLLTDNPKIFNSQQRANETISYLIDNGFVSDSSLYVIINYEEELKCML